MKNSKYIALGILTGYLGLYIYQLSQQQTITETKQKLAIACQENAENEKVLEQLLQEFQELNQEL